MHITRCIIPVTACFFILCHCIVVMSSELYEKFTKMNRIDQAFEKLNKKDYG